ncbi:MAG: TrkA family potassium uptake protein [Leptolyngbya sp. SIO4C5]|uniref:potassium channel family protein n=1 Tax=Sphaerothrix gracilis TaxID=3151835 RepID=UPI0013BF263A|nr:TrkA family potassium uptake protein [Leptolyngbya sp. SIO4C5]
MRVILIGSGKLAYFLSKQFTSKGYYLTIITPDEGEAVLLSRQVKATVMVGDGSNPLLLQEAEAYGADVLLALTNRDQDNLIACQIGQDRYGVPRTIALVNDPDNREVFQKLGVTMVFSATEILGSLIEQQADYQDVKNLVPISQSDVTVTEFTLQDTSPAVGHKIQDLKLTGAAITCIIRGGRVLIPSKWMHLRAEDRLILVSESEHYGSAQRALAGGEP